MRGKAMCVAVNGNILCYPSTSNRITRYSLYTSCSAQGI